MERYLLSVLMLLILSSCGSNLYKNRASSHGGVTVSKLKKRTNTYSMTRQAKRRAKKMDRAVMFTGTPNNRY